MVAAIDPLVQCVDALFLGCLQFVGRQVGYIFVTGVRYAGHGFSVVMDEAARAFFEEGAGECRVLVAFEAIGLDRPFDAFIYSGVYIGRQFVQGLFYRGSLEPRYANVDKMGVEAARSLCLTSEAVLCPMLKLGDAKFVLLLSPRQQFESSFLAYKLHLFGLKRWACRNARATISK